MMSGAVCGRYTCLARLKFRNERFVVREDFEHSFSAWQGDRNGLAVKEILSYSRNGESKSLHMGYERSV